jgi:protein SCO1
VRRSHWGALSWHAVMFLCLVVALPPCAARAADPQDEILREIGVDEHLGARVPADLVFTEASGKTVRLGDYLGSGPVLLTLNYFTCPMLCPLTFRNLAATVSEVKGLSLARDYRIVTVSFNPEEIPEIARVKARETRELVVGLDDAADRWPFLYGSAEGVRRLTGTVGYRYKKVGTEFAHPAAVVVLSPDGSVSRYLYGIEIPPRDLKLALVEAADGKIGASSAVNTLLMYCFHYDPVGKKYALVARNVMKLAGVITLVFLAALFAVLWRRREEAPDSRGKGD